MQMMAKTAFLRARRRVAGGPTLTYIGSATGPGTTASQSFTGVNIGTAAADRIVVVVTLTQGSGSSGDLSSATIGGIAATVISEASTAGVGIAYAVVPTGTTATIAAVFGGSQGVAPQIAVYTITGAVSSTPVDTSSQQLSSVTSASDTLSYSNGVGVVAAAFSSATPTSVTWSGATSDFIASNGTRLREAATITASGTVTATPNPGATTNMSFVAAVWQ